MQRTGRGAVLPRAAAGWSFDRRQACGAGCSGRGLRTVALPPHAPTRAMGAARGHASPTRSVSVVRARARGGAALAEAARARATLGARWRGEGIIHPTGGVLCSPRRVHCAPPAGLRAGGARAVGGEANGVAEDQAVAGKRRVVAPLRDLLGEKVRPDASSSSVFVFLRVAEWLAGWLSWAVTCGMTIRASTALVCEAVAG
jgi:hypothetical protein